VEPVFLQVTNELARVGYNDTTESIITTTLNEHSFRYSGFVMATQYDDPALSLRRHILKTSSLTDPDTGECSIQIQFKNGETREEMTGAAESLLSALCNTRPSLKYQDVTMYVDTVLDPDVTILSQPGVPQQINLTGVLVSNEYEIRHS
jgi:uncharacterized protein YjhX (UPF0386 family)